MAVQKGWSTSCLDQLEFRSLDSAGAFGFVDPAQVLRGCHIIPKFSLGKRNSDDIIAVSVCANSAQDWVQYYANRSVQSMAAFIYYQHALILILSASLIEIC